MCFLCFLPEAGQVWIPHGQILSWCCWGCNQCLLLIKVWFVEKPCIRRAAALLAKAEGSSGNIAVGFGSARAEVQQGRASMRVLGAQLCWVLPGKLESNRMGNPSHISYSKIPELSPISWGFIPTQEQFPQLRTPPTLPCLQHTDPNTSQRSQGRGSCMDWPFPGAEAKFPGVKGCHIHTVHYSSMAPDWNSWFTQGLVNRDLACLVFSPSSLQVDDSCNHDNFFVFSSCSSAVQEYYSEKEKKQF